MRYNRQIIVTSSVKFFFNKFSHEADCQIFYQINIIISKTGINIKISPPFPQNVKK